MGIAHKFNIDPRISPKQFMELLGCKTTCFYGKIKRGEIQKPHHDGRKITYWYASYVKEVVERSKLTMNDLIP
nr:hypothetical protein [uncultured Acinetobacter sp.]